MKKIIFLLLITIASYGQTYQNPTFGNVKIKSNATDNTATKVNVQATDGTVNTILKTDLQDAFYFASASNFPITGIIDKLYIARDNNILYRFNGTIYVPMSADVSGKEDIVNKSSSFTASSTVTYANTKALVDGLATKVTANTAIVAGTNTKITYDAKGLITAGTSLSATDIPNIAQSQVTNLVSDLGLKANLASPALTGVPTAPTPTTTTGIANKGYVDGLDVGNVKLTGNQTIAGNKTFSASNTYFSDNIKHHYGDNTSNNISWQIKDLAPSQGAFSIGTNTVNMSMRESGPRFISVTDPIESPNGTASNHLINKGQLDLKQNAITGLTTNYLPKWNGSTFVNSQFFDNGNSVGINGLLNNITFANRQLGIYELTANGRSAIEIGSNMTTANNTTAGTLLFTNQASSEPTKVLSGIGSATEANVNSGSLNFFTSLNGVFTSKVSIRGSGNVLMNTNTDNGVDKVQVNGSVSASKLNLEGIVSTKMYSLSTGTSNWIRLATVQSVSNLKIVGTYTSEASEETFTILVGSKYHTSNSTGIYVKSEGYNRQLLEVRVEGADAGNKVIFIRVVGNYGNNTLTYAVSDALKLISVDNAVEIPILPLYTTMLIPEGERVIKNNYALDVGGTITASPAVNANQVVVKSQLDAAVSSGTYTVTYTPSGNITAVSTVGSATYMKIGNIATVYVPFSFTTNNTTIGMFKMTIPFSREGSTSNTNVTGSGSVNLASPSVGAAIVNFAVGSSAEVNVTILNDTVGTRTGCINLQYVTK